VEEEAVECEEGDEECLAAQEESEKTACEEGDTECEAENADSADGNEAAVDDSTTNTDATATQK
jgi:hypothetical protein